METQDMNDVNRNSDGNESGGEQLKDFCDPSGYDEGYEDDDGGNSFRGGRGRGNFRYAHNFHVTVVIILWVNYDNPTIFS